MAWHGTGSDNDWMWSMVLSHVTMHGDWMALFRRRLQPQTGWQHEQAASYTLASSVRQYDFRDSLVLLDAFQDHNLASCQCQMQCQYHKRPCTTYTYHALFAAACNNRNGPTIGIISIPELILSDYTTTRRRSCALDGKSRG